MSFILIPESTLRRIAVLFDFNPDAKPGTPELEVEAEKVSFLFSHGSTVSFVLVFNALILCFVERHQDSVLLSSWFLSIVLLSVLRYLVFVRYRNAPNHYYDSWRWGTLYSVIAFTSAFLWGVAGIFFFDTSSVVHQAFVTFIVCGTAVGSITALSVVRPLAGCYLLFGVVPIVLQFLMQPGSAAKGMASLLAIFLLAMFRSSHRTNELVVSSLRLRSENDELLSRLSAENERAEALNRNLHLEIEERRKTQGTIKKVAEELALKNIRIDEALTEARAASEAKGSFLATMSHEIRTPMNAIIGLTDIVLDSDLSEEQRSYIDSVKSSADSLLVIINDVLDFSKIEAGRVELHVIPASLSELTHQLVTLFGARAKQRGIKLELDFDESVASYMMFDAERVKQVLVNLIHNAIKFTEKSGEVRLAVACKETDGSRCRVKLSVSDTGIGIPKKMLEEIFESFTQVEHYTTRSYGGTGLGLSISRQLVDLMGGKLEVESEEGKGSKFFFTLDLENVPEWVSAVSEDFTDPDSGALFDANSFSGVRVLLAEDNKLNQHVVAKVLEKYGCVVSVVKNGKKALEELAHRSFDILLMDCQMPVMDGYEATRLIREKESESIRIPIIALTAHAMVGARQRCLDVGMDDYLSKPIDRGVLLQTMAKYVKQKTVS